MEETTIKLKKFQCCEGICDYCKETYASFEDFENNELLGTIRIIRNDGNTDTLLAEFCSEECLIKWIKKQAGNSACSCSFSTQLKGGDKN